MRVVSLDVCLSFIHGKEALMRPTSSAVVDERIPVSGAVFQFSAALYLSFWRPAVPHEASASTSS